MIRQAPPLPSRVLMTTDAVGGVWHYAVQLSTRLARAGCEIVLAVLGPKPSHEQHAEIAAIKGAFLESLPGKLEWMPESEPDVSRAGDWLLHLEDRYRPDVVHLNGYCHGALPWRGPVLVVAHSCLRTWWRASRQCEPPVEWDSYARRVARGLRSADMVVAPTVSFLKEIEDLYGPFRQSCAIANGRDPDVFRPLAKRTYAMSAGRFWDEAKNFQTLERVAERAAWPIMLAGEVIDPVCGLRRPPKTLAYLGRLSQPTLARWLGHASIFVHPAIYEPFGLSVLEAACAGCALVLADIPTLRELWNGAAVFVDPRSEDDLTHHLNALAGDPERLAILSFAARQRGRLYGADRMAERYLRVYGDLIALEASDVADAWSTGSGQQPRLPLGEQQRP